MNHTSWTFAVLTALLIIRGPIAGTMGEEEAARAGTIEGVVTYTGPLPRPIPVAEALSERHLVVRDAKTNGLKEAVVWIEGVKGPESPPPKKAAFMDQQNFFFLPHVLAVEAGQEVEFFNSDGANHGVRATHSHPRNCFNIITAPGTGHKYRFVAGREPVKIDCPVHATMSAWVFVFDHPYHCVTGADGTFKLPPLPPGKYTLKVHHASGGMWRSLPVTVKEGETQKLKIEFGKDDLKVGS